MMTACAAAYRAICGLRSCPVCELTFQKCIARGKNVQSPPPPPPPPIFLELRDRKELKMRHFNKLLKILIFLTKVLQSTYIKFKHIIRSSVIVIFISMSSVPCVVRYLL